MGLRWDDVEVDWLQRGWGPDGELWAQITGYGPLSALITRRASGEADGVLLRGLASWEEARAAVEAWLAEREL